ncbi:MAG: hypothetical protein ABEK10_04190 [Candidatus Nanosalina sp.]
MEDAESIKSTVEAYMSTAEIPEDDLYIDMQLEFDLESNNFTIEYGLTSISSDEPMNIGTSFKYDTLAEAWENYLDQLPEVHRAFPEAEIKAADPEEYAAGKVGGNPVMSIRDASGEL